MLTVVPPSCRKIGLIISFAISLSYLTILYLRSYLTISSCIYLIIDGEMSNTPGSTHGLNFVRRRTTDEPPKPKTRAKNARCATSTNKKSTRPYQRHHLQMLVLWQGGTYRTASKEVVRTDSDNGSTEGQEMGGCQTTVLVERTK